MNCVKATAGFNIVLERLASQQHQLSRMRQEKLEEFKHIKEEFKHQYREKTEVLKERSSQQWNQAKETAKLAAALAAKPAALHAEAEKEE